MAKFEIDEAVKFIGTVDSKWSDSDEGRIDSFDETTGNYTVKSAGHLVYDVPESSLEPVYKGMDKSVDETLRARESKKEFKDSDVRVQGSKKEMMAYKGLINKEDLEAIEKDAVMARTLIKKDKVIPKFNTNEQIDKGVSGGTLFLKLELRRLLGNMPPDTPEFRKIYVGLAEWVYELFNETITRKDYDDACEIFVNGVIRKSLLIANPQIEKELQKQNEEWEEQVSKVDEYRVNASNVENKIQKLLTGAGIFNSWNKDVQKNNFPEEFSEWQYWYNLYKIADRYKSNKILPIEYKYLYLLYVKEGEAKKSILTRQQITEPQLEYFEKAPDAELIMNYSNSVRQELIESVFGDKFYYFIKQNTYKAYVDKAYLESKKYEEYTQEEYDKVYENSIKPLEEKINKYKEDIEFVNDSSKSYKEKLTYAIASGMGSWFWTRNRKMNLKKMFDTGRIDEAIRLMENVVNSPVSGYAKKIAYHEKEIKELKELYFVRENNYSFLDKEEKERKKRENPDLIINSSEPLSYIKRYGGVAIYDEDMSDNDKILSFYKNILGITRITYGLSLPDKERKIQARCFAGSVLDMAEALNWDVKELTGLGNLGILFAASGHGRAMAHFSSTTNAINLTRSKGDGSVSHETLHYIDFNISKIYPNDRKSEKNNHPFGSYIKDGAKNVSNTNIQGAYESLMRFIIKGLPIDPYTIEVQGIDNDNPLYSKIKHLVPEFISSVTQATVPIKVKASDWKIGDAKATIEETIEDYAKRWTSYFEYGYYVENKKLVEKKLSSILTTFNLPEYVFHLKNTPKNYKERYYESKVWTKTAFFIRSSEGRSSYWTEHEELFARAGECFIMDVMAGKNRSNNYLVSGVNFLHGSGVYPQGIERKIINILYQNLFDVIKSEMKIADFVPFRNERTDEYVEIKQDEEEDDSIIVVEQESGNVIESPEKNEEELERVIKIAEGLIELLKKSKNKFDNGGQINTNKMVELLFT